jgi:hypothetical protein
MQLPLLLLRSSYTLLANLGSLERARPFVRGQRFGLRGFLVAGFSQAQGTLPQ